MCAGDKAKEIEDGHKMSCTEKTIGRNVVEVILDETMKTEAVKVMRKNYRIIAV